MKKALNSLHILDFDNSLIHIYCQQRIWTLHRPGDLESRWEQMGNDGTPEEHIPYWLEVWPASLAMGLWLSENKSQLMHATCLEIGCGLGFCALIAATLGAKVLAFDYENEALHYARLNAFSNYPTRHAPSLLWCNMDWRHSAIKEHQARYIWGSDILYEKIFIHPLLSFLEQNLAPDGCIWIADPHRNIYTEFIEATMDRGWSVDLRKEFEVPTFTFPQKTASVGIWEFRIPSA